MNDNDIIKALGCCNETKASECSECPLLNVECSKYDLYKLALDLINRQKAENERLKSMNQSKLDIIHDVRTDLETAKSEAIKEFAERFGALLADFDDYDTLHIYEIKDRLDLVKEMTEGKE